MPRIFKHLEAGWLQVNLMSTSAQINQLKYTVLYYTTIVLDIESLIVGIIFQLKSSNASQ